jgi:hypothetical protein
VNEIQTTLFEGLAQTTQPKVARTATIQERFEAFHALNPKVYAALRALALEMVRNGVKQYGIKGLTEKLRWEFAMQTKGDTFKICNSYTSRYARLLVENEPALKDFFELRVLTERDCEVCDE